MKNLFKYLIISLALIFITPTFSQVHAQCGLFFPGGEVVWGGVTKCSLTTPGSLITVFLPAIFSIAGFITVIIIVISGIQFITSSGNPEAAAAARGRLIFALVGFALIILAFAITKIIDTIFLGGTGAG